MVPPAADPARKHFHPQLALDRTRRTATDA
jgi:hypothetical protein